MQEFITNNVVWITPVFVAVVSGIFYLLKKGGSNQKIGDVDKGGSIN